MARISFADEDDSGRDPLTGSGLGDPAVAVRLGVALTLALVIARLATSAIFTIIRGRHFDGLTTEWLVAFAAALPLGAALTVMAWRDRPGRPLVLRAMEATLLATLAWAASESWAFFHLQTWLERSTSVWLWALTTDFHARLPGIGGTALGLLLAARQRGRHAVGIAFEIPSSLGALLGLALWWPTQLSAVGLVHSVWVMLLAPVVERIAQRTTTAS